MGAGLIPGLTWRGKLDVGVPVKDYILQSELFAICAFGLIGQAVEVWRSRVRLALGLVVLAAGFIGNLLYVQTARTTLVAMAVLVVVFALRKFGWIGALGAVAIAAVLAFGAWMSSPYLRERVAPAIAAPNCTIRATPARRWDCGSDTGERRLPSFRKRRRSAMEPAPFRSCSGALLRPRRTR